LEEAELAPELREEEMMEKKTLTFHHSSQNLTNRSCPRRCHD
jgi:hypothetical protein